LVCPSYTPPITAGQRVLSGNRRTLATHSNDTGDTKPGGFTASTEQVT
jgi:hypothetical protein